MIVIPIIQSSQKRLRQSQRRHERNLQRKKKFKQLLRQIRHRSVAGQTAEAQELLPQLMQAVDKAARHHTIHPNKAARIKSRLMHRLQRPRP